ncbi:MAG: cytochrome c oxidase subunit II [candidate division NC10 bacterium]|nr:cytochrome c oxidase subunit II [candidate division NC10 bacterium]
MMSWLPENVSTYGGEVDFLFYLIYYITGATFLLVTVTMLTFLIVYRRREGRRATYSHGNTTLEIIWTIVPAIILVVLSFMSQASWARIKSHAPPGDVEVQVTSKQFNWEMTYPGPDGKFGTADDLTLENQLHVPVGKVVRVHLRSKDVIHSFFLPNLRLKQDTVPGREILAWFQATKAGKYEIPCAELCGFGHSGMKGWLYVHPAEEYAQWVKEKWPSS